MAKNNNQELWTRDPAERMSTAERVELAKLIRLRAKVTRNDIDAQIAQQLAHVEQQLAATYQEDDSRWATITNQAEEVVRKADAEIARRCQKLGVPASFRPKLQLGWHHRGENASKERREELRRVAESELEARAKTAKVVVDRAEVDTLTKITAAGLRSDEAVKFLAALPTVDQLMPQLQLQEIEKRRPLLDVGVDDDD